MNHPDEPAAPATQTPGIAPAPRRGLWHLLLPALLLPLWIGLGYAGIELTWRLHLAWHPQDVGHTLEYWRRGMTGPRFLMLIPPMVGALPLAMFITNAVMHRIGPSRGAGPEAAAHYAASQRALRSFAALIVAGSAAAAALGAWLG
jgi:hypothetical protein